MNQGLYLLGGGRKKKYSRKKRRTSRKRKTTRRRRKLTGMKSLKTTVLRSRELYNKFAEALYLGDYEEFKKLAMSLPKNIKLNNIYIEDEYKIKTFLHNKDNMFNDPYNRSLIFRAVENRDLDFLKLLVKSHFKYEINEYAYYYKIDDIIGNGLNPLILACYNGYEEMVKILLNNMIDRNIQGSITHNMTVNPEDQAKSWTPLIATAYNGNVKIAEMLLARGVAINKTSPGNVTPLHHAVYNNNLEMVIFLVENNANLNEKTSVYGDTPLAIAKKNNNQDIVNVLINAGAK